MNKQDLSPAVTRYFDLMDSADKARVIEVFTPDATVLDDGHTYTGRAEILEWVVGPASEFTTTSTWLSATQKANVTAVVIRLEGNFPGGWVDLRYEFTEESAGLISALAITV